MSHTDPVEVGAIGPLGAFHVAAKVLAEPSEVVERGRQVTAVIALEGE